MFHLTFFYNRMSYKKLAQFIVGIKNNNAIKLSQGEHVVCPFLVPKLCLGMPSTTLRVVLFPIDAKRIDEICYQSIYDPILKTVS
jgi:hypothetical protein